MSEEREPSPFKVTGANHAFRCGLVMGIAGRYGVPLEPEVDEDGNWAASGLLTIPDDVSTTIRQIRIVVPPPEDEQ